MKFSLQTLIALSASVAIVMTCLRSMEFGIAVMAFILPFSMMLIAITSPRRGHQLDPSSRWYLFVLAKTWGFTVIGLFLLLAVCFMSPYLRDSLVRTTEGKTPAYQIVISFPCEKSVCDSFRESRPKLYDARGLIGEVRGVAYTQPVRVDGVLIKSRAWVAVSTYRADALKRSAKEYKVDIWPDGSLHIVE